MAAWKIKIFAQNPPVGGTPASETMNVGHRDGEQGAVFASPAKSVISSCGSRSADGDRHRERADVHDRVDQDVGDGTPGTPSG